MNEGSPFGFTPGGAVDHQRVSNGPFAALVKRLPALGKRHHDREVFRTVDRLDVAMTAPVVSLTVYRTEPARLLMLVRRMAENDRNAFSRLYDALLPEVTATVLPLRANPIGADEVIAATFVEAWQSADLHTGPDTDVAAWIDEVAARRAGEPEDPGTRSHPSTFAYPPAAELEALLAGASSGRRPPARRH